jgi:hypothetical protein
MGIIFMDLGPEPGTNLFDLMVRATENATYFTF